MSALDCVAAVSADILRGLGDGEPTLACAVDIKGAFNLRELRASEQNAQLYSFSDREPSLLMGLRRELRGLAFFRVEFFPLYFSTWILESL